MIIKGFLTHSLPQQNNILFKNNDYIVFESSIIINNKSKEKYNVVVKMPVSEFAIASTTHELFILKYLVEYLDEYNTNKFFDIYFNIEPVLIERPLLITENYYSNTLTNYIYNNKEYNIGIVSIIKMLFSALYFLHNNGIAHQNLTCDNIIISSRNMLNIIDYRQAFLDVARSKDLYEYSFNCANKPEQDENYIPPEILRNLVFYPAYTDVWCVGLIMFQLMFRKSVFKEGSNIVDRMMVIKNLATDDNDSMISSNVFMKNNKHIFKNLLKSTLQYNIKKRMKIEFILKYIVHAMEQT